MQVPQGDACMPWSEITPMHEKTQFIADYLRNIYSVSELCARYRISRKTGYKWIDRYLNEGPQGLEDRLRAPHEIAHRTPQVVIDALVELRQRHPTWGAKKLLTILRKRQPTWQLPARATVYELFKPYGLIQRKTKRRSIGHPGPSQREALAPNDIWCADFKGQFKLGNGQYCYPLTVTDQHSRFLLACQALPSTATQRSKPVFAQLFRKFGMPKFIRTDNGVPFATTSLARLSTLSAWWIQLGVLPDLIEPGKPQQNGRHERMHRTLKAETTRPAAYSPPAQQRKFNRFIAEFNNERPHEALEMDTPASRYHPSKRAMPAGIARFEYPDRFEVRYVSANGGIRWNRRWINVSSTCIGQYVGLEEIDHEVWDVYFGPLKLGRLHERKMRIEDAFGKLQRHQRSSK
jgi:putative transposase